MHTLGGICRWMSSLPRQWAGRSGADYRAALRENSVVAFHMEAADGRVLSLLVRDGRLKLHSDLPSEDAVRLVMGAVDFALRPAPSAAIFRVTVDDRTSEVRRVDGHLVHSGDLPASLPARIFMASIAGAIESKSGALMCGAIALDGRRIRGHSCQQPHRELPVTGQLSAAIGVASAREHGATSAIQFA
jgi:hypothetical protein